MASKMRSVKGYPGKSTSSPKKEKKQELLLIDELMKNGKINEDKLFFKHGIKNALGARTKANRILKSKGKRIEYDLEKVGYNKYNPFTLNHRSRKIFYITDIKKSKPKKK